MGWGGGRFSSLFVFPSFFFVPPFPPLPSLFVRAAVPGMTRHGHGVLILHDHELGWVGLGWAGRAGRAGWLAGWTPFIYIYGPTKHLQFSSEEQGIDW